MVAVYAFKGDRLIVTNPLTVELVKVYPKSVIENLEIRQ